MPLGRRPGTARARQQRPPGEVSKPSYTSNVPLDDPGNGFNWIRVKFFTNGSNGPKPLTFMNCGVSNAHWPATSYIAAYRGPAPIDTKRLADSQPGQARSSGKCVSSYQVLKAASCSASMSTLTI